MSPGQEGRQKHCLHGPAQLCHASFLSLYPLSISHPTAQLWAAHPGQEVPAVKCWGCNTAGVPVFPSEPETQVSRGSALLPADLQ